MKEGETVWVMDALDESKLKGEEEESENALVEKYESTTRTRNLKGTGNNMYDPYKRLILSFWYRTVDGLRNDEIS